MVPKQLVELAVEDMAFATRQIVCRNPEVLLPLFLTVSQCHPLCKSAQPTSNARPTRSPKFSANRPAMDIQLIRLFQRAANTFHNNH
jgi:hypothetical protein